MTPFQMHFGRKPRTAITNLIGQPEGLLSNWKKTLTNYISAQPTELQTFTINDSEGEMADYIVLNDSKKRVRSVSPEFKQNQFFEKEQPNALKCRFKINKLLTAVKGTKHTITTSEGKTIHKKLASNPVKFQLSRKPGEKRKSTNKCRRCGKFCQGNSAIHIKECTEFQRARKNRAAAAPYRRYRRNDPPTATSLQPIQRRT